MAVRPTKPNLITHKVQTVLPRSLGYPVVQSTIAVDTASSNAIQAGGGSAIPAQGYAEWDWLSFIDRANDDQLRFRSCDAYFAALASAQAYVSTSIGVTQRADLLPSHSFERIYGVGPFNKSYDIYDKDGYMLIAFPGTQSLTELFNFAGVTLKSYSNLPVNWWFWDGFFDTGLAYAESLAASLEDRLAVADRFLILTGHSLGGVLAAWFAHYLNYISPHAGPGGKPVIACYSFAAPAGWVDVYGLERFTDWHRHYRVLTPGDPVPSILQTASLNLPSEPASSVRKWSVTQHYDTLIAPVGLSTNFLPFGDSLGKAFWQLLAASGAELSAMIGQHSMSVYLAGIESQCRAKRDTPVRTWDLLNAWSSAIQAHDFTVTA